MIPTYEIGSMGVIAAIGVAFVLIILGFQAIPASVRITAIGATCMYLGYQVIEFILQEFVVIAV